MWRRGDIVFAEAWKLGCLTFIGFMCGGFLVPRRCPLSMWRLRLSLLQRQRQASTSSENRTIWKELDERQRYAAFE